MINPVPERLINFRVYREGNNLVGVATVDMPDIEAMTDTVSGAGIAGEIDSPTLGHLASMAMTITFRTVTEDFAGLAAQTSHALEVRGSQQVYDAGDGVYRTVPIRVAIRGIPKRTALGSFEVSSGTDSELELELTYMKIIVNNRDRIEIDKYNFKYVVDGVDYLQSVRDDLGL